MSEDVPLRRYARLPRRHWVLLVFLVSFGTLGGLIVQAVQGTPVEASQRIFVRDVPNGDVSSGGVLNSIDFSLDTEAQIMRSDGVVKAIRDGSRSPMTADEALARLDVSALPNTRILVLQVTLPDTVHAQRAATAAAQAYLTTRGQLLDSGQSGRIAALRQREKDLSGIVTTLSNSVPTNRADRTNVTKAALSRYNSQLAYVVGAQNRLTNNPTDPGELAGRVTLVPDHDPWLVKATSGFLLGLSLWALLVSLFDGAFERISHRRTMPRSVDPALPVIAHVRMSDRAMPDGRLSATHPALTEAARALETFGPVTALLAPVPDPAARAVADALDDVGRDPDPGTSGRVVLVTPHSTRVHDVHTFERQSRAAGLQPVGVIVVDE